MSLKLALTRWIPDKLYLQLLFLRHFHCLINFRDPKTFNEKLQWLKLYDRRPEYTRMVDKYEVKKYIAERIGEEYVIPTLGVWDTPEEIDFDALPDQFVLKWNHDSGSVVICKDKAKLDRAAVIQKLQRGKKYSGFWYGREWPYKNVRPRILAEEYLEEPDTGELRDYKLMCFNGEVRCSFVCSNRFSNAGLNVTFYDRTWQVMPFERKYPASKTPIPQPQNYERMIALAEKLSKNFPFVRVDFYECRGKIYFGELTLYPGSGLEPFFPEEWDERLGALLTLPK